MHTLKCSICGMAAFIRCAWCVFNISMKNIITVPITIHNFFGIPGGVLAVRESRPGELQVGTATYHNLFQNCINVRLHRDVLTIKLCTNV